MIPVRSQWGRYNLPRSIPWLCYIVITRGYFWKQLTQGVLMNWFVVYFFTVNYRRGKKTAMRESPSEIDQFRPTIRIGHDWPRYANQKATLKLTWARVGTCFGGIFRWFTFFWANSLFMWLPAGLSTFRASSLIIFDCSWLVFFSQSTLLLVGFCTSGSTHWSRYLTRKHLCG